MIGLLGMGGIARGQDPARIGRAWRATAVLGMLAAALVAAGVRAAPAAAAPIGYIVTATVGVGSAPTGVGVDPSTHTIYVANGISATVSVIDGATNAVTATIPVGVGADAVGVDPSTHTIYVASEGTASNTVSVIDGATNAVTTTIRMGETVGGVAVDPSTHTVYVTTSAGVSVIDGTTNAVTGTIPVAFAVGVAVDPSTHTAYVTTSAGVSVIDGTTDTVTGTIAVPGGTPDEVAVDPAGHTVFATKPSSNGMSIINGTTDAVIGNVGMQYPVGVGVDLSTHTVYVTNPGPPAVDISGTVSVITPPQPGPASVTATAGNSAAAVSWTAPAYFLNDATVTGYTASAFPGNETCSTTGATSCTITGLTNLTTYSINVIAHTSAGDSAAQTEGVNVVPWGPACPCTLWPPTAQPTVASANEASAVNLGVQFTPAVNGWVTGIRFYKGPGNTGTHIGYLWTASGALLGQVAFARESASGWQEADFSSRIAVTADTTYVASYFAPNGGYSYTAAGFAGGDITNGPLTAPQSSAVGGGNGVFGYSGSPSFPNATYHANNYWVDVVFTMAPGAFAPTVSSSTPGSGSAGNPVTAAPMATFSQAVVPSSVSFTVKDSGGNSVAGTVSFNAGNTVATFTPANSLAGGTSYTATVSGAQNSSGTPMASPYSWTFTTAGSQCPCSLWPASAQPAVASASDPSGVNLGVQFTPSADGWIAGIRFYRGQGNTGAHTGELWTADGTLLGKVTFTGESTSGWQEADFSSPIAVTGGTTYVASYFAPNGGYSYDPAYFASAGVTSGPLTAPQSSAVSGGNGVYSYDGSPSFPNASYNANNYWVDVVFTQP